MKISPERRAILAATGTAVFLTLIKTIIGLLSGSMAVLSSATDSLLDFFVSLVNLLALKKSESQATEKYRYGFGKIEGMGAIFEGTVVSVSGLLIGYFAIQKLISGQGIGQLGASLWVMAISMVVTGVLVWYLNRVARETGNLIIQSDALHYKTDLLTNGGVLIALVMIRLTGFVWIDGAISLVIAVYILHSAFGIIQDGYHVLMDGSIAEEEEQIAHDVIALELTPKGKVNGYHAFRTRRSGKKRFIEFHLVFDTEITLVEAHRVSNRIECEISRQIPGAEILVHLDPADDSEFDVCEMHH